MTLFKVPSRQLPGGTEKNHEKLSQDKGPPSRSSNLGPPKYEAEVLTTRPRRSVWWCFRSLVSSVLWRPGLETLHCSDTAGLLHCVVTMTVRMRDVFLDMDKKCWGGGDATSLRIMKLTFLLEFVLSSETPFVQRCSFSNRLLGKCFLFSAPQGTNQIMGNNLTKLWPGQSVYCSTLLYTWTTSAEPKRSFWPTPADF
jgi:hypothetical protein